ncbi:ankyrin repeat [Fusarium albosuccineum]|uniref:Ankyrin repeat n=1 Tax=Fusarium albosuccineum TaxID=1237068 RepID=A0A8H4P2L6_9HYPO|nr:ankyrin repeat [Fusarium albosuccineum]
MSNAVATKRIPEQEWARHESTIRQLYLENDKGLQDVMEHMASSCGFYASKSQYETRFKKWGIAKNRKRVEWKVVAQHVEHRKAAGKKSDVFINGALVSEARVQREMTRIGYRPSRGLSSSDMQLSVALPLERPAYIDPRSMLGLGDLSLESALLTQHSRQSSPSYTSKLLDNIVLPESSLLAFLPPALVTLRTDLSTSVNQKTTSPFTSVSESQPLSSPYARLLIFQLINGFIHRSGLTPVDVWNFLKANAGRSLRAFFQRLPQQEAKILAEKAFPCAIEAGNAEAVGFFLDAPDINI